MGLPTSPNGTGALKRARESDPDHAGGSDWERDRDRTTGREREREREKDFGHSRDRERERERERDRDRERERHHAHAPAREPYLQPYSSYTGGGGEDARSGRVGTTGIGTLRPVRASEERVVVKREMDD